MTFISKKSCVKILAFAIALLLVLGLHYIFYDQLTDPHRWLRMPELF